LDEKENREQEANEPRLCIQTPKTAGDPTGGDYLRQPSDAEEGMIEEPILTLSFLHLFCVHISDDPIYSLK
jgi:hypothetical protein